MSKLSEKSASEECCRSRAERRGSLFCRTPRLSLSRTCATSTFKSTTSKFRRFLAFSDFSDIDLIKRFNDFLSYISGKKVFVDPKNHGGGLHQGKKNSSLDMHLDFNYHPLNNNWFRQMNILLYLNTDWKETYKGHLKLEDLRTGEKDEVGVPFNRVIIQECGTHSLHGYDQTYFPEGNFRTSIATYAYTVHNKILEKPRTTDWFPTEDASSFKKFAAKHYNKAVKIKNKLFGSGTAKNQ
mgnify:CR=1 FL=1